MDNNKTNEKELINSNCTSEETVDNNKVNLEQTCEESINNKKESLLTKLKKKENIIGVLLLLPIYVFIEYFLVEFYIVEDLTYVTPFLMFIPMIIGIIMTYIWYPKKVSIIFSAILLFAIGLSGYFYYITYCVNYDGYTAIGYFILMYVPCTLITRLLSFFYYRRIFDKKKQLKFFLLYIFTILFTYVFAFLFRSLVGNFI